MTPYKCPVCGGTGIVPNGFYSQTSGQWSSASPETCRSCGGTGIVWEQKTHEYKLVKPPSYDGGSITIKPDKLLGFIFYA